jgi:hypothetical protein
MLDSGAGGLPPADWCPVSGQVSSPFLGSTRSSDSAGTDEEFDGARARRLDALDLPFQTQTRPLVLGRLRATGVRGTVSVQRKLTVIVA